MINDFERFMDSSLKFGFSYCGRPGLYKNEKKSCGCQKCKIFLRLCVTPPPGTVTALKE